MAIVLSDLVTVLVIVFGAIFYKLIVSPYLLWKKMQTQGIKGPKYRPIVGHFPELKKSHDSLEVCGIQCEWKRLYGGVMLLLHGPTPRLSVTDPQLVKQIFVKNTDCYGKMKLMKKAFPVFGTGLVFSNGEAWHRQRKLINPSFAPKMIKKQITTMLESVENIMDKWDEKLNKSPEVEMAEEATQLALDLIIRTSLGRMERTTGKSEFMKKAFMNYMHATIGPNKALHIMVPGFRNLPLASNREREYWQKQIMDIVCGIIEERKNLRKKGVTSDHEGDFLGTLLPATGDETTKMSNSQLVNECFTFLIGGHDTVGQLLVWSIIYLAKYPQWQDVLRQEVEEVWPAEGIPDMETLSKLKNMHMVMLETMRLFPPIFQLMRECTHDNKVGNFTVYKGVEIQVPLYAIHTDLEIWGKDAQDWKPERFKDGVAKACSDPLGYMPFGLGPRICIAQTFAMTEVKVALGAMIRRYSWTLSPEYKTSYAYEISMRPGGPVPIILKQNRKSN